MSVRRYVMQDQVRDKIDDIMGLRTGRESMLEQPAWVALALLVAAFNLIALTTPA